MANNSEIKNPRGVSYCYADNLLLLFTERNDKIYVTFHMLKVILVTFVFIPPGVSQLLD